MEASSENIRVQRYVLIVAILLFGIKMFAWFLTQSLAVLTDSLESVVNVITGFMGLYSLKLAAVPRDRSHPYGHGKIEFISAGIEGALIFIAGIFIIVKSGMSFFSPTEIEKIETGIAIIAVSAVINFGFGAWAIRTGKRNNSLALQASGSHLQTDTYTTLGIIIGLLLIKLTGYQWLDGAAAIFFAVIILFAGYKILRKAVAGIMDESDEKLLNDIVSYLQEHREPKWIDLHNLRIIKFGSVLHIDCHLTLPWYLTVKEGHDETEKLTKLIVDKFGESVELMIHTDYCEDFSCNICTVKDCPVRQAPFVKQIEWTLEKVISKDKHRLQ